jgi:signal peptidase I
MTGRQDKSDEETPQLKESGFRFAFTLRDLYVTQMSGSSQEPHSFITTNKETTMASKTENGSATLRSTVAFAAISMISMLVPALVAVYFGLGIFTVTSDSMKPYMAAGDGIITGTVLVRDIQVGDVILFVNPDNLEQTSHRVVQTMRDNRNFVITTKGDANPAVDSPAISVNADSRIQKVIIAVPKIGFVLDGISSTATKTGGAVVVIAYLVYAIRKARRKVEAAKPTAVAALTDAEIAERVENLVREHLSSIAGAYVPTTTTSPTQNQNNRTDNYL